MSSQKKQASKVGLSFRIIKIHTTTFSIEDLIENEIETLFIPENNSLSFSLNHSLTINKEKETITIDVHSKLMPTTDENRILVNHIGRTTFEVKELNQFYLKEGNTFDIPDKILQTFHSVAYTHARALLAVELSPTPYKDRYFLPVLKPSFFTQPIKKEETK